MRQRLPCWPLSYNNYVGGAREEVIKPRLPSWLKKCSGAEEPTYGSKNFVAIRPLFLIVYSWPFPVEVPLLFSLNCVHYVAQGENYNLLSMVKSSLTCATPPIEK